jgi:hypothetical protein
MRSMHVLYVWTDYTVLYTLLCMYALHACTALIACA